MSKLKTEDSSETNTTSSPLPIYTSSSPTPPPSLPSPINSPPSYHTISQHNLYAIIRQQQKQLAAMQAQIQALIVGGAVVGRGMEGSSAGSHMDVVATTRYSRSNDLTNE